jgi:hypothetical protein
MMSAMSPAPAPDDEAAPPTENPDWPREAARALAHETLGYLRVVWQTLAQPRRFYAEWADGTRRALNPLAVTLNSVAVVGIWRVVWQRLDGVTLPDAPWWLELIKPAITTASHCLYGVLVHGAMRLLGARRPLRTTLGATLYCSAGPLTLISIGFTPLTLLMTAHRAQLERGKLTPVDVVTTLLGFVLWMVSWVLTAMALGSAQRQRAWRVTIAVVVSTAMLLAGYTWLRFRHPLWYDWLV